MRLPIHLNCGQAWKRGGPPTASSTAPANTRRQTEQVGQSGFDEFRLQRRLKNLTGTKSAASQIRVLVEVFRNSDRDFPGTWVRPRRGRAPYWDTARLAQEIETRPWREFVRLRGGPWATVAAQAG